MKLVVEIPGKQPIVLDTARRTDWWSEIVRQWPRAESITLTRADGWHEPNELMPTLDSLGVRTQAADKRVHCPNCGRPVVLRVQVKERIWVELDREASKRKPWRE